MGLVAPWHVGTSQIRARTCVYCIGRWSIIIIIIIFFFTTEPPGKPLEDPAFLIESPSLFRRAVTALFFPCLPEVLSGSFLSF